MAETDGSLLELDDVSAIIDSGERVRIVIIARPRVALAVRRAISGSGYAGDAEEMEDERDERLELEEVSEIIDSGEDIKEDNDRLSDVCRVTGGTVAAVREWVVALLMLHLASPVGRWSANASPLWMAFPVHERSGEVALGHGSLIDRSMLNFLTCFMATLIDLPGHCHEALAAGVPKLAGGNDGVGS